MGGNEGQSRCSAGVGGRRPQQRRVLACSSDTLRQQAQIINFDALMYIGLSKF